MGRFIFTLPDDKLEEFRALSEQTGVPMSYYLRDAVDGILGSGLPCTLAVSGLGVVSGSLLLVGGIR